MRPFIYCVTLLAGLAITPLRGQETTSQLPKVIVQDSAGIQSLTSPNIETATAVLEQIAGGTGVVDGEDIRTGRAFTLKDALDYATGVFVQPRFGAEESRISIRGSGIQRTFHGRGLKLLQDGVPLNLADGGFDFQAVDPLTASYVEVFRGANALEFGSTTLGGAINFVSHTGYTAPRFLARAEFGSFDTYRGQLAFGGVEGPLDYYLSLSHLSTDGFRDHSQQSNQRLFANIGYKLSDIAETRFYFTYARTESELPGNLTKAQLEDDPTQAARNPFAPIFDYVTSDWQRNFDLYRIANKTTWETGDHRFTLSSFWSYKELDHPILFVIDQKTHDFGIGARYDYTGDLMGMKNRLTLGFNPTFGVGEDERFANVNGSRGAMINDSHLEAWNLDFYAEDQLWLNDQWALSLGTQVSYAKRDSTDQFPVSATDPDNSSSQDWWGFSPKLGLLYAASDDIQFFGNVSRSFEPPSFGELTNPVGGGAGLIELDAQTATSLEFGTRGSYGPFTWDAAYYFSWIDNELLEYTVAPGLTKTVNAGRTIHQGVELGFRVNLLEGMIAAGGEEKDVLFLHANYLWNDFHHDNDSVYGDNRLPGIPEHYVRAELLYEHPSGFYIGPNVEWVPVGYAVDANGALETDGYILLGAKVGWKSKKGLSIYLEGRNLTDERYAATTGVVSEIGAFNQAQFSPGDGRGFYGGIEFRW